MGLTLGSTRRLEERARQTVYYRIIGPSFALLMLRILRHSPEFKREIGGRGQSSPFLSIVASFKPSFF
jgi:hypothetical protein